MNLKNNYSFIYFIKAISIFMVFVGHYFLILRDGIYSKVYTFYELFPVLLDESFWMIFLCISSGFLLYKFQKKINSFVELVNALYRRFMRFLLPLLWVYLLIYLIMKFIPNYGYILGTEINNTRLSEHIGELHFYDIFVESLKTIFFSSDKFSGPFWMLGALFRANISVIIFIFINNFIKFNNLMFSKVLFLLLLVYNYIFNNHSIGISVVFGYIVAKNYYIIIEKIPKIKIIFVLPILILLFINFFHKLLFDIIFSDTLLYKVLSLNYIYLVVYALIIFIIVAKIFESFEFNVLNFQRFCDFSFDFYGLHMCIICTFSSFLIWIFLLHEVDFLLTFFVVLLLTSFFAIFISFVSHKIYLSIGRCIFVV